VSVSVTIDVNGARVPVVLDDDALAAIATAVAPPPAPAASPYMTIVEAAEYLRCKRARVDDLLSQQRLTRFKDGARTLIARDELQQYLTNGKRT
jgi:excisionase family DNA binding protein